MRHIISILAVFYLILMAACVQETEPPSREQGDLAQAQERWQALALDSYRFNLRQGCFCPPSHTREGMVFVEKETIRKVLASDDHTHLAAENYYSIESLFELIADAVDNRFQLQVSYHLQFGYPLDIRIDEDNIAGNDNERHFSIDHMVINGTIHTRARVHPDLASLAKADAHKTLESRIKENHWFLTLETSCEHSTFDVYIADVIDKRIPPHADARIIANQGRTGDCVQSVQSHQVLVDLQPLHDFYREFTDSLVIDLEQIHQDYVLQDTSLGDVIFSVTPLEEDFITLTIKTTRFFRNQCFHIEASGKVVGQDVIVDLAGIAKSQGPCTQALMPATLTLALPAQQGTYTLWLNHMELQVSDQYELNVQADVTTVTKVTAQFSFPATNPLMAAN